MSKKLWDEEYEKQNIASSFKGSLSHSIKFLLQCFPHKFLDLGCGNGRNAIPLARMGYEVVGMDISKVALRQASEKLKQEVPDVEKCVNLVCGSMCQPLPFRDSRFDVVMDITSFDILIKAEEIECHRDEVGRVLKSGGYFLYYDMAEDDPYALDLLAKSPDKDKGIIYTPTGIPFKIYSSDDVEEIFYFFDVCAKKTFKFQDTMDGKLWNRSVLCMIFSA